MVTMRDVAQRAGVSIATVSFLLNDTKPVTAATRARIEQAMVELGYRRNMVARALASRRTHIIAMAYPALEHRFGMSTAEFFTSAAEAARKQDYHLVKAEVEVVTTISAGLFLVRLAKGSRASFEQTRVNDEVWLPRQVRAFFSARLGLLKVLRIEQEFTYSNCRQFQTDTPIISQIEAK